MTSPKNSMTRRSALSLLAAGPVALHAMASTKVAAATPRMFLGTYTDPVGTTPGAKGIYSCPWDATTGTMGDLDLVAATPDPTFLASSARQPGRIFAVNELTGDQNGKVTTFARRSGASDLTPVNVVSSGGFGPCHLALDRTGRSLYVANYGGGCVASYKVTAKGLSEPVSVIRFTGHGPNPDRQEAAHTHCVTVSPDNRFLLVNDLGLDRIMVFHMEPATAKLIPAAVPYWSAAPGAGPRHSVFHPKGEWVYSVNELNSTIDLLEWKAADGTLTHKATISSLPESARGRKNAPAEVTIDSSGRFLYMSNRFHDSIGVFTIGADGTLTSLEDMPCGGKTPRHFTIDPSGRWVIVANQDSRNIVVFERDHETGRLTATGRSYILDAPVCVLFG